MRHRFAQLLVVATWICGAGAGPAVAKGRVLEPEDFYRIADVRSPQVSPDGAWIVYVVGHNDRDADEPRSELWMVSWDGKQQWQLTSGLKDADSPRFSPDGSSIAFTATPAGADKAQVLLLDRRGGEPRVLTHESADIQSFDWSPDGKRMVLVESGGRDAVEDKKPHPIVIDAMHFKQDVSGYIEAGSWQRLKLLDIGTREVKELTGDKDFREDHPAWSPDGRSIAYVRTREVGPDAQGKQELMRVEATPGAAPRSLARVYAPNSQSLAWSPDGKRLAFLQGLEIKFHAYIADRLFVMPAAGGAPTAVSPGLDRAVTSFEWAADGRSFLVSIEDDQSSYPARLGAADGKLARLLPGQLGTIGIAQGGGHVAVVTSTDATAPEVRAVEGNKLRKLTSHNDALMAELDLGAVEDLKFNSAGGVEVHGLLVKPPGYVDGRKYPTILWIHGGPGGQDEHSLLFDGYPLQLERQMLAGQGYVVLAVNYRGSSGRGAQFQQSIFADWGHHEVEDLRAAVDHLIQRGIADEGRLGLGGWSYGGILTDFTIASDARFRAAVSGAGSANNFGMFGTDQYVQQYINELGEPWKAVDLWKKVSYAFFDADKIVTPTLFLGGEKDFNVPIAGGEQMYQALRVRGVPAQLVIYPEQFHIFTRPSFIVDRAHRVRDWYARYLK